MSRTIGWFSAGAASAVACKLSRIDLAVYCETGSEDQDNARFLLDVERWLGMECVRLKSDKFADTWDVWEKSKYISGTSGAPCTRALKINPRLAFQLPDDIHVFGFTADKLDVARAIALRDHYPDLMIETPLIDRGLTKAACLSLIEAAGIQPPRVYAMGFKNANCIPCCKATSPGYWALVRKEFPVEFERMNALARKLGARLCRFHGERIFIDELPADHATSEAVAPECDFLCQLAEDELGAVD